MEIETDGLASSQAAATTFSLQRGIGMAPAHLQVAKEADRYKSAKTTPCTVERRGADRGAPTPATHLKHRAI
jgi:hypothetical protein